jgi:cholera toxin transcriptional activator
MASAPVEPSRPHAINAAVLNYGAMSVPLHERRIVRFGVFELDLEAGELRKGGVKLRLQGQPFQVLATLLERPGQVVTRDELRQRLWPSDTFVDFDHSLNTAINKVRELLGDSATAPRYIETLARRGYRFIAPLQVQPRSNSDEGTAMQNTATRSGHSDTTASAAGSSSLHPELSIPIPNRAIPRSLFGLIQVMYLTFYLIALFRLRIAQLILDSLLAPWAATTLTGVVMITAGVGIPLRCYLISAIAFDYRRLGETFHRIFPGIVAFDQLWAFAPFLLIREIGLGGAFAVCAALLYVPFSERALIRMAYARTRST